MKYTVTRIVFVLGTALAMCAGLIGQVDSHLYVVTGLPTPSDQLRVGSAVFSVDQARQILSPVTTLVGTDRGSRSIVADHQHRVLVITTPNDNPTNLVVLHMDAPDRTQTIPISLEGMLLETSIFDNGSGALLALGTFDRDHGYHLTGIDLMSGDTATPRSLPLTDYRFIRREGWWAPSDQTAWTFNLKAQNGRLITRQGGGNIIDMEIPTPNSFEAETDQTFMLDVSNEDMVVIDRSKERGRGIQGPLGVTKLSIYDKRARSWSEVMFDGGGTSIRAFGSWLVANEAYVKLDLSATVVERTGRERESSGPSSRQRVINPQDFSQDQVKIDDLFLQSPVEFSGVMYLYDIHSKRKYTINTAQGDSEVLLVQGNVVYYRVNDSLYRAQIGAATVGNAAQIARDENIQLAHWAFLGP